MKGETSGTRAELVGLVYLYYLACPVCAEESEKNGKNKKCATGTDITAPTLPP
ncbi:MAG: hypothetical protein HOP00_00730 [Nitrospira sp.]|nr:hypothetical protein [Nitrospira sp.]